jgi:outer membrane protein assembly factor BamB/orotate phosphoribosyltransferase
MISSPSQVLSQLIRENVYKEEEIRKVSFDSRGQIKSWIFDFKSQALSKIFLQEYSRHFWEEFSQENGGSVQVAGMETGAIPLITGISLYAPEKVKLRSFYIRKSRKKSDLANLVEGEVDTTVPVILVDDILNTASTTRKLIAILEEKGCRVAAVFVCLRFRELSAYQDLIDKGIRIVSIFELNDFSTLLPVKNISPEQQIAPSKRYEPEYKVTLTSNPNLYLVVPKSGPVVSGKFLYMGADDGYFYCLRKEDGSIAWTYKVPFGTQGKRIFSTSAIYKESVIFGAYDGNLYCLDKMTGKIQWVFFDADWIGSSPCINEKEGIVYVGLEFGLFKKRGGVAAVDIKTGRALWKNYGMEGLTHASPAYDKENGVVVCGCNDHHMYAFDARTGVILWRFKTGGEVKYGAVFDDARNAVVFGSMDGGIYVLDTKTGKLIHKFEALFGFYSTPVISGNRIIIGSLDKVVYCFDMETKNTEWKFETSGRIFASPVLDGDSVFVGSNDGRLYELDISTGRKVAVVQLTERIVNRVQVERNKEGGRILYIPTHTCELYRMKEI